MVIKRGRTGEVEQDSTATIRDNETDEYDPRRNTGFESPLAPFPAGNAGKAIRALVEGWNAAYRGRVPHGITVRPATPGAARSKAPSDEQFDDNPDTYEDGTPVTNKAPEEWDKPHPVPIAPIPVVVQSAEQRQAQFFTAYTQGVTSIVDRIIPRQDHRVSATVWNAGPGIIYIAENESKGVTGLAIPISSNNPIQIPTTREVWAVQQSAQSGPAQVGILLVFERQTAP